MAYICPTSLRQGGQLVNYDGMIRIFQDSTLHLLSGNKMATEDIHNTSQRLKECVGEIISHADVILKRYLDLITTILASVPED